MRTAATLGLDATIQVQVLDLLVERCRQAGMGAIIITHDLGIVARYCDRLAIMRDGRIIEEGITDQFPHHPTTDYGAELLSAARARPAPMAKARQAASGSPQQPILDVANLVKHFTTPSGHVVKAVDDVSFNVPQGETLALVGESGSGKTTVGQCLVRLLSADSGTVLFDGQDVLRLSDRAFRPLRRNIQMVFQEPYVALNPRWTVERLISEPLALDPAMAGGAAKRARVSEMLDLVHLPRRLASAYPHELTAGEQKRVAWHERSPPGQISSSSTCRPPRSTSAFARRSSICCATCSEMQLATLFITHDLNSVRSLAHNVAVMRNGRIVEIGETERIFEAPSHDYTRMLLGAELPIERYAA